MEPKRQSNESSDCAKRQLRREPTGWPEDCMPCFLIWRGGQRPKFLASSKFTAPRFLSGCGIGNSKEWREFWRDTAPVGPNNCRASNCRRWRISWIAALWPTDSTPAFGPARWFPELLKKNSRLLTIRPMFLASFTSLNSLSNAPGRSWPVPIKMPSPAGCVTATPILKKSQKRRGRPPLRRRSHLPARSDPLPNLGPGRLPTRNPHHWAEKGLESLWHHRAIWCPFSLPLPRCLQRPNLYPLSGKAASKLLSMQNLSDPGQCLLPQGPRGLGLAFSKSHRYRSLQSANLFSRAQCFRKSLALYSSSCHSQPLLRRPG